MSGMTGVDVEHTKALAEVDELCTHEHIEWGLCAGCAEECGPEAEDDYEPSHPLPPAGCGNRGWYHDGSEQQAAAIEGRAPQPCPHHRKD